MSRTDRIAVVLSLLGVLGAFLVHGRVFEYMAHVEDEMAYVWQAQAIAGGNLTLPSPPGERSFLVPFVIDHEGQRFGKYPLGWPALLAAGIRLGARSLVNPLLAGFGVWLTYLLGKRIFSETAGLLAAGLTVVSPFFLMNSASLLSHPLGLVLSAGFALSWLEAFARRPGSGRWSPVILASVAIGLLAITRPLTAVGVALPFAFHGSYLLLTGSRSVRKRLLVFAGIAFSISLLQFVWQYIATGSAFTNLYTLWWEYDRIGFGPGHGNLPEGHSLEQAIETTRQTLENGIPDLFGWQALSWIFLPFGVVALLLNNRRRLDGVLVSSVFPSLVLVYLAYWIGAFLFGPRYYYEGFYSLTILSGAGIAWLAGWSYLPGESWVRTKPYQRLRSLAVVLFVSLLTLYNLFVFTPTRLRQMHGLYGVERAHIEPFLSQEAQQYTPALVVVHPERYWIEYGTLIELTNPYLDTPFIFVISRGESVDSSVIEAFPERNVFHYYQDEPYRLYTVPRPGS
jgi:hypothetical protein